MINEQLIYSTTPLLVIPFTSARYSEKREREREREKKWIIKSPLTTLNKQRTLRQKANNYLSNVSLYRALIGHLKLA